MFWLGRPPYLRWAAALLVVAAAAAFELSKRATIPYPFAISGINRGEGVRAEDVEWRQVPVGLLDLPELADPIAARDIGAGEPITPAAVTSDVPVPDGWWAVPVGVPPTAAPGSAVRLILTTTEATVDGIVVAASSRDALSISDAGLVAVAADRSLDVAIAAAEGTLVVLVEP